LLCVGAKEKQAPRGVAVVDVPSFVSLLLQFMILAIAVLFCVAERAPRNARKIFGSFGWFFPTLSTAGLPAGRFDLPTMQLIA